MASNGEQKRDETVKGFAGLSSMVSNVDTAITNAKKETPKPSSGQSTAVTAKATPHARSTTKENEPSSNSYKEAAQPPAGDSSVGKWFLSIGAVIGVLWLLSSGSSNKNSPTTSITHPTTSVETAPASDRIQQTPSRLHEEKPPVGTNHVHGPTQLRYCLAEEIRLDAAKVASDNFVEADVDRFNTMVADYNNRCGEFRYYKDSLETARSDVERYRSLLEAEGAARFVKIHTETTQDPFDTSTNRPDGIPVKKAPAETIRLQFDPIVLAIQTRLNELGYDAGVVDGLAGEKTRTAISAFQRDYGLSVDGIANDALLRQANSVDSGIQRNASIEPVESDLSQLSSEERQSIESACLADKLTNGPAVYNKCLSNQLARLTPENRRPDLSQLSSEERQSIESACLADKLTNGPAAYNKCLSRQLSLLRN